MEKRVSVYNQFVGGSIRNVFKKILKEMKVIYLRKNINLLTRFVSSYQGKILILDKHLQIINLNQLFHLDILLIKMLKWDLLCKHVKLFRKHPFHRNSPLINLIYNMLIYVHGTCISDQICNALCFDVN